MLKVSNRGSVLTPNSVVLLPGTQVTRGVFTDDQIREHLRSGFMVELGAGREVPVFEPDSEAGPAVGEDNVGDNASASQINAGDIAEAQARDDKVMVPGAVMTTPKGDTITQGIVPKDKPVGEKLISEGKWNDNPVELQALDIDSLNLRVLEKDPDVTPFSDKDEVVAFLSMDYREPKEA
jgi:hypothetical protein